MSDIAAKVVTALNWSRVILLIGSKFMVRGFFIRLMVASVHGLGAAQLINQLLNHKLTMNHEPLIINHPSLILILEPLTRSPLRA